MIFCEGARCNATEQRIICSDITYQKWNQSSIYSNITRPHDILHYDVTKLCTNIKILCAVLHCVALAEPLEWRRGVDVSACYFPPQVAWRILYIALVGLAPQLDADESASGRVVLHLRICAYRTSVLRSATRTSILRSATSTLAFRMRIYRTS